MSFSQDEVERLMDQADPGRGIDTSLYCAGCGYNLRGLPHNGTCPECGGRYNTRSHLMKGIFLPHRLSFPVGDFAATVLSLLMTAILLWWGLHNRSMLLGAVFFGVLSVLFLRLTVKRVGRYMHFYRILRRIENE
jgi:hypothetical protein